MHAEREFVLVRRFCTASGVLIALQVVAIIAGWLDSDLVLLRIVRPILVPLLFANAVALVITERVGKTMPKYLEILISSLLFLNIFWGAQFFLRATLPTLDWINIEHDFSLYYHGSELVFYKKMNVYMGTRLLNVFDNGIGYVATPVVLLLFLPFTFLPFGVAAGIFSVVALGMGIWSVRVLDRSKQWIVSSLLLSILVFTNGPFLLNQKLGQISALVAFLIVAGIYYLSLSSDQKISNRHKNRLMWVSSVAIAGSILIKVFPVFTLGYLFLAVLVFWFLKSRGQANGEKLSGLPEWQILVRSVFVVVIGVLVVGAVFDSWLMATWWKKIRYFSNPATFAGSIHVMPTLGNYLHFIGDAFQVLPLTRTNGFIMAAVTVMSGWQIIISMKKRMNLEKKIEDVGARQILEYSLLLACLPFVLPMMWCHYLIFLIVPVVAVINAVLNSQWSPNFRSTLVTLIAFGVFLISVDGYLRGRVYPNLASVYSLEANLEEGAAGQPFDVNLTVLPEILHLPALGSRKLETNRTLAPAQVMNLYNLLFGFPGCAMVWLATFLTLKRCNWTQKRSFYRVG